MSIRIRRHALLASSSHAVVPETARPLTALTSSCKLQLSACLFAGHHPPLSSPLWVAPTGLRGPAGMVGGGGCRFPLCHQCQCNAVVLGCMCVCGPGVPLLWCGKPIARNNLLSVALPHPHYYSCVTHVHSRSVDNWVLSINVIPWLSPVLMCCYPRPPSSLRTVPLPLLVSRTLFPSPSCTAYAADAAPLTPEQQQETLWAKQMAAIFAQGPGGGVEGQQQAAAPDAAALAYTDESAAGAELELEATSAAPAGRRTLFGEPQQVGVCTCRHVTRGGTVAF